MTDLEKPVDIVGCPPESLGKRPVTGWRDYMITLYIHCPFYGAQIELFGDTSRNYVHCVYEDCKSRPEEIDG